MRKIFTGMAMVMALVLSALAPAMANNANPPGKTTIGTTVIADETDEMNYGDGIPNGEWITTEVQGVILGLRATDRFDGVLNVTGTKGDRVGVYEATTGFDGLTTDRAEWNYEWSVDLSGAKSLSARGKTIADYSLTLEQDFVPLYGTFNLLMPDVCGAVSSTLCQESWNPMFFGAASNGYNVDAEATYNLRLVLTPTTFNGPVLAVAIQVNVTD